MRFVRYVVSIFALLSLAVPLAAQNTGTITGRVIDTTSQQPLPGVGVPVVGTDRRTVTGEDGTFLLTDVPSGIHELQATRIGYALQRQQVTVSAGATATAQFA